ncbi:MAG TPA: VWA domain-containing protein [Thermoanaerobaculia bacterium]|nr:VWA domain-containing protein [Thermoanaerobaculia bacterium]
MISWLSFLSSLFLLAFQISAEAPAPVPTTESGLAVEALDRRDAPLREPKTENFAVTEEGVPRRVLGVETGKPWRVVVYVDRILAGTRSVRGAAGLLAAQAQELTALGPVEVVIAEPEPRPALLPTRDPAVLDDALSRLLLTGDGRDDLRVLRQRFLAEVGAPTDRPEDQAERLEEAVAAEARLAGHQQDVLLEWLADARGQGGPRVLFLVSDGFDLDPRAPYLGWISDRARRSALGAGLADPSLAERSRDLARSAAALGWTVLPMPVGNQKLPELGRWRTQSTEQVPIGVVVTPGRKKKDEAPAEPAPPELADPRAPLAALAEETGGEVLTTQSATANALARLRSRVWVRYEAPAPSDGALHPIEVRVASAEKTKAGRWSGPAVPDVIAVRRAQRLLAEEEDNEDLPAAAMLRQVVDASGIASWLLELRPEEPARQRLTLAIPSGSESMTTQRLLSPADLADGVWRVPLSLPSGADRIAVVLDDPAGGPWGSRLLPVVTEQAEEEEDDEPILEVAEAPVRTKPWSGRGVRIVSPAGGKAIGPVDVEIDLRLPPERRLERLEIFWNDELAATLYGAPYRHRVNVPRERPVGYLRASALLDDGTTAEDAVLLNSTAMGERLDVRLVELYVVVTDRNGRPVRGLTRNDFRLLQDGRDQAIAGFDDAGSSPLSLGLAFDSSASMFLKLPDVREAARTLLTGGLSARDRALLVDFDSEPRLVTGITGDLATVSSGLDVMRADGGSDLFEAIVFSLQKLQGVAGRKALVVYSDGIGEGEKTSYRTCIREARRSNVPIYLIVTNQKAARAAESGILEPLDSYAERLDRLAAATGGRAFFVMPSQNLREVYDNILRELRSQYLLTYYPREAAPEVWRKVGVEVKGRGYQARTVSGFYTR